MADLPQIHPALHFRTLGRGLRHLPGLPLNHAIPPFEALAPAEQRQEFVPPEQFWGEVLVALTVFGL